jgi:hypothetical protein
MARIWRSQCDHRSSIRLRMISCLFCRTASKTVIFIPSPPEGIHKTQLYNYRLDEKNKMTQTLQVSPAGGLPCLRFPRLSRGHTPATLYFWNVHDKNSSPLSFLEGVPLRDDWREDAAGRHTTASHNFSF